MASCQSEPKPFCGLGIYEAYGTFMPALYAFHSATIPPLVDEDMQQLQVPRVGVYGDSYDLGSPMLLVQTVVDSPEANDTGRAVVPPSVQSAVDSCLGLSNHSAAGGQHEGMDTDHESQTHKAAETETHSINSTTVRVYVLLQSLLERRECAHFTCTRDNEVSLVPHLTLFGGSPLNGPALHHTVLMGVFHASGVRATHQDVHKLEERGLAFGRVQQRAVSVHDSCFSPANAQVRFDGTSDLASFVSVCSLPAEAPGRRSDFFAGADPLPTSSAQVAVTLHMLPTTEQAETQCMHWIQKHAGDVVAAAASDVQDALPVLSAVFNADAVAAEVEQGALPSGMVEAAGVARALLQLG